ncbi:MAG TPA: SpoIVB peptidase S55 domain-containing protein, partial [Gemmataceae bacterium]|nr:SpoIVB peptidase S55 domain-containing protein [Gemmataceae bacterium]
MSPATRPLFVAVFLGVLAATLTSGRVAAAPGAGTYWNVEEVRAGMKGQGRTVMKGTKVEIFQVEVLGVLRNTSPGRDLVLCRLSGLGLEKTGVIAGMSGSPVYLDGKLLGAVSYAWAYGKEPIAGVTPFSQMHGFVEAYERRDVAEQSKSNRVGLAAP